MKCTRCSQIVRAVVAIDIDGTLGDYYDHFVNFCEGYFGAPFRHDWDGHGEWEDYLGLTKQEYRDAKLAYRQGGQKRSMPLLAGARRFMARVNNTGCEVWLTTTRPWLRLDSVDPDTREWLRRTGFMYHHLLYDDDKYQRLSELVDKGRVLMVVDDLVELCQRASFVFGPRVPVQITRQHNSHPDAAFANRQSLDWAAGELEKRVTMWEAGAW